MSLIKRLALVVAACVVVLAALHWYFRLHAEYYFPDRYEDAFTAYAYTLFGAVVAIVAILLHHLAMKYR